MCRCTKFPYATLRRSRWRVNPKIAIGIVTISYNDGMKIRSSSCIVQVKRHDDGVTF